MWFSKRLLTTVTSVSKTMKTKIPLNLSAPKMYEKVVQFETEKGNLVDLRAVYEDSLTSGSSLGTVIGFHGSPGSHKDFKYIRHRLDEMAIRFIGINYPGFKHTEAYPGQRFTNVERQRFSEALLDELEIPGKIIIMGHSRGCENALITTTHRNPHGLVMINPTGLRIHKGSRPKGKLESLNFMHKQLGKKVGDPVMYQLLKSVGFKIKDGAEAVAVIRSIQKCDLEKQLDHILKLNEMPTKTMITFGGRDHLIEKEIIFESLQKYQGLKHFDTIPSGSSLGTVVGFHGSPGSHKDFKYVRSKLDEMGIRFIGINYPGFGNTLGYENQGHTNPERQNYTNALLDTLKIEGKIIFIGHSRGCENALQTAVGRPAHGLVLINPTGFRHHKGIRPVYRLEYLDWLYGILPTFMGNAMIMRVYKAIGFRVKTGEEAICALRSAMSMSFENQIEYIEKLNETDTKKLIIFGGNDHLVEEEIVLEKLEKHDGLKHFRFEDSISEEEKLKIMDSFSRKGASVFVAKDTHFQNKSQAVLVAEACGKMLETA